MEEDSWLDSLKYNTYKIVPDVWQEMGKSYAERYAEMVDKELIESLKAAKPQKKNIFIPDDSQYIRKFKPYYSTSEYVQFYFPNNELGVRCSREKADATSGVHYWKLELCMASNNLVDSNNGLVLLSVNNPIRNISPTNILSADWFMFPDNKIIMEIFLSFIMSEDKSKLALHDRVFENMFNYTVHNNAYQNTIVTQVTSLKHNYEVI